ncbi:MAG: imidazoleglycerol-phosphate dehydratase HisB [Actinobacteria bacterium]|nr:imidazoleglycerol-phosphate dehydratase HisB [Actinomycetota bacterium]
MPRKEIIKRKTKETDIELEFNLDGSGKSDIATPFPFLNHVLESFARHGNFDLRITASGDINVDPHHLIEDIGICLGLAISACLKNKEGITRFGHIILPMDEVEISISLDLGGRSYLRYNVDMLNEKIENMSTGLVEDFFRALVNNSHINLHINKNVGVNSHHIIEAIFKAFGIALKNAIRLSGSTSIPSTKGVI